MKTPAIAFLLSTAIFSFTPYEASFIEPRNFLDDMLINLLNKTFQDLQNLTIPEVDFEVDQKGVNASFSATNLTILNLENIEIEKLETTIIPLKVKNITLRLAYANLTADHYDLSAIITSGSLQGPVDLFGSGKARINLEDLFLTAAIDFTSVDSKLQIKKKGIHDFDVYLGQSIFGFENLLGNPEMGEVVNVFLGYFLPHLIADFKQEFLEEHLDQIIDFLNKLLKDIDFP